jgi:hypothetical protein
MHQTDGRIPDFNAKSAGLTAYPANADDGYPWLPSAT